jgi:hypothetical protein
MDTLEEIYHRSLKVTFQDRIQEVRFFLRIERCVFPVPGHYQIKLLADGEEIAQQRFRVLPLETPE